MDGAKDVPANGVGRKEVAKELGNDAQTVRLVSVDGIVVLGEGLFEKLLPHAIELAKTLTDQAEELVVGTFLRAALDDHRRHLMLQTRW